MLRPGDRTNVVLDSYSRAGPQAYHRCPEEGRLQPRRGALEARPQAFVIITARARALLTGQRGPRGGGGGAEYEAGGGAEDTLDNEADKSEGGDGEEEGLLDAEGDPEAFCPRKYQEAGAKFMIIINTSTTP